MLKSMEGQSGLSELSVISWVSAIQGCPRGSTVEKSESWQLVGGLSCQRSDHRATPPGNHLHSQTSSTTAGTDLFINCQQRTID